MVIATRDRRDSLLRTLERLQALPERPPVTVLDNASSDGTVAAVAAQFPAVRVLAMPANLGAAARNAGAALVSAPYVAFSDDDSWWAPEALTRAADVLDAHPRVAVVAARVRVGPAGRLDPTCALMARSPLPAPPGPGPAVLGFLACGAVARRRAFLDVGGFDLRYGVGGEEELLAVDLAAGGWELRYCPEVVAHHHPVGARDPSARRRRQVGNTLRTAWLRRRRRAAVGRTLRVLLEVRETAVRRALLDVAGESGWLLRERQPVPAGLEAQLRLL